MAPFNINDYFPFFPYRAWVSYVVYFSDQADYDFAVDWAGSNVIELSPTDAANTFGLVSGVHFNTGGPLNAERGMYGFAPYGIPPEAGPWPNIKHPNATGVLLKPFNLHTFVPGQPGIPANAGPGRSMVLTWTCTFLKTAPMGDVYPGSVERAPVPRRRWIAGFEYQALGEGGSTGGASLRSRDSSRTLDGLGWGLRNSNNVTYTRLTNEFIPAFTPTGSWERFYMRVRKTGGAVLDIWQCSALLSPAAGARLQLNVDGSLTAFNVTAFSVVTTLGTSPVIFGIDDWHKVDIIVEYNPIPFPVPGGGSGRFRVFVDGTEVINATVLIATGGLGVYNQVHNSSTLGTSLAGANTWEVDFDDWHNADIPVITANVESLTSIDWLMGTHVSKPWVIQGGTTSNYTGQNQSMNQMITPINVTPTGRLTSNVALATLNGLTDVGFTQDPVGLSFTENAALISKHGFLASGSVAGRLGFSVEGGLVDYPTPVTESNIPGYSATMYKGDGIDVYPSPIAPFTLTYEKANNAILSTINALSAIVQSIGVWGLEDDPEYTGLAKIAFAHNAWYPNIAWAFEGPTPDGPTMVRGGTYVGNGTTQFIDLPLPCHFLWIRPLTGGTGGVKWFGANIGGHLSGQNGVIPELVQRIFYDETTETTQFEVVGTNANSNAVGVVYQYIAFCDPAFQYNLCGSFMHAVAVASSNLPLIAPNFLPAAGFFQFETLAAGTTDSLIYKGPGNSGSEGTNTNGANVINVATFGTGMVVTGAGVNNNQLNQTSYSLWRSGNACADIMCQIFSYVGNGVSPRVITSTPAAGRYPLFVYVQPANAVGYFRDPSDTGSNSHEVTGGAVTTNAIQAGGNDTITVGSLLNQNLIVYNVFIIPGSDLGWLNGTYYPGNCSPEWFDDPPPADPPPAAQIIGEGGLILNGQPPTTLLKDISGIYTLIPGKTNDTLYDRQPEQDEIDMKIPDPKWKTGYVGG